MKYRVIKNKKGVCKMKKVYNLTDNEVRVLMDFLDADEHIYGILSEGSQLKNYIDDVYSACSKREDYSSTMKIELTLGGDSD